MGFFIIYYKYIVLFITIAINHIRWVISRFTRKYENTYTCLVGKTAIVTGGSTGQGYETCKQLASRGCRIIIASNVNCESEKQKLIELSNNPNIIIKYLDLASFSSVRKFAEDIKRTETKIEFLINNAGVGVIKKLITDDGYNSIMQINYFGHFLLTHLLVDQLKAAGSARVVFVASSGSYCHNMEANDIYKKPEKGEEIIGYHYFSYYNNAKLCSIIAVKELGKKLSKYGITVNSVDPGVFLSQITQAVLEVETSDALLYNVLFNFLLYAYGDDVYGAGKNIIFVLTADNIENGELYFRCKPNIKPHKTDNQEFCRSIWDNSEKIAGLRPDEILE